MSRVDPPPFRLFKSGGPPCGLHSKTASRSSRVGELVAKECYAARHLRLRQSVQQDGPLESMGVQQSNIVVVIELPSTRGLVAGVSVVAQRAGLELNGFQHLLERRLKIAELRFRGYEHKIED